MDISKPKKDLEKFTMHIDETKDYKITSDIEEPICKFDAIISIDENGNGNLVMMLTNEHWKLDSHSMYDPLPEIEFKVKPGLYYANMSGEMCGGDKCRGNPCAGDCFETDWELGDCIFEIDERLKKYIND